MSFSVGYSDLIIGEIFTDVQWRQNYCYCYYWFLGLNITQNWGLYNVVSTKVRNRFVSTKVRNRL